MIRRLAVAVLAMVALAPSSARAADPIPIFDAHLHYN